VAFKIVEVAAVLVVDWSWFVWLVWEAAWQRVVGHHQLSVEVAWSALWYVLSQELAVAGGHSAGAINMDDVLVELANLNHHTCRVPFIPFSMVWASLVLDSHMVANC